MRNVPDHPPQALGDAMSDALDRALGDSMTSLRALHDAVRGYAVQQKSRGIPLDDIIRMVTSIQLDLEDERTGSMADFSRRDPVLTTQLRAWCSEGYSAK